MQLKIPLVEVLSILNSQEQFDYLKAISWNIIFQSTDLFSYGPGVVERAQDFKTIKNAFKWAAPDALFIVN